eukprot:13287135-Ditylum_brightwellii.AAC.1
MQVWLDGLNQAIKHTPWINTHAFCIRAYHESSVVERHISTTPPDCGCGKIKMLPALDAKA